MATSASRVAGERCAILCNSSAGWASCLPASSNVAPSALLASTKLASTLARSLGLVMGVIAAQYVAGRRASTVTTGLWAVMCSPRGRGLRRSFFSARLCVAASAVPCAWTSSSGPAPPLPQVGAFHRYSSFGFLLASNSDRPAVLEAVERGRLLFQRFRAIRARLTRHGAHGGPSRRTCK